jgi:NADH-quinone oxidoreductase subunit C
MVPEELKQIPFVAALEACGGVLLDAEALHGELTLEIAPEAIESVCRLLKQDFGFIRLSSITSTDWHPMEPRFHLAYHLHSIDNNRRVRLLCKLSGDSAEIDSLTGLWGAADWYEREVFDLFGVRFRNHPNLRRIMMPEDWKGHPLRKDFPVHGYKYSYQSE